MLQVVHGAGNMISISEKLNAKVRQPGRLYLGLSRIKQRSDVMRRHLVKVLCAAVAASFLGYGLCSAQGVTIGYVDLQKFLAKSKKAQAAQKKLMELSNKKREELEKKQKELLELNDQLKKQGPMLKEETRNQKIRELQIKEMDLKLAQKEAEALLQNEQRDLDETARRDLSKIFDRVRTQKKLTVLLNGATLLSADPALDLTDEVVKIYDAEASTGKPAAPAAAPTRTKPADNKPKPR